LKYFPATEELRNDRNRWKLGGRGWRHTGGERDAERGRVERKEETERGAERERERERDRETERRQRKGGEVKEKDGRGRG